MNYAEIKKHDIANGEGVRVSLFVSGCSHHCKGCFNEKTWDFKYGREFNKAVEDEIIEALKPEYIKGFSLLGGEPFEIVNQRCLVKLLKRIKDTYPNKTIWCYSGFTYEQMNNEESRCYCEVTKNMLSYIDVLVDGPFVQDLKNISLKFRGSSNQRLIDLNQTRATNKLTLIQE